MAPRWVEAGGLSAAQSTNLSIAKQGQQTGRLQAQFPYLVVVILAVKNVPLLASLDNNLALRGDLLARCLVDLHLLSQHLLQRLARLLADGIPVVQELTFVRLRERIGHHVRQLVEFVPGESHNTALYLRASSCFTFLNISA